MLEIIREVLWHRANIMRQQDKVVFRGKGEDIRVRQIVNLLNVRRRDVQVGAPPPQSANK